MRLFHTRWSHPNYRIIISSDWCPPRSIIAAEHGRGNKEPPMADSAGRLRLNRRPLLAMAGSAALESTRTRGPRGGPETVGNRTLT